MIECGQISCQQQRFLRVYMYLSRGSSRGHIRHIARTAVRPPKAAALVPHFCVAPVPGKLRRAGVIHWACHTLDARHRLAALARFRVTLCEVGEKAAVRHRRPWHRGCWRGHDRDGERLERAIFIATAIRSSARRAAAAAMLTVMATGPIGHFARVMTALASMLVACVWRGCGDEQEDAREQGNNEAMRIPAGTRAEETSCRV